MNNPELPTVEKPGPERQILEYFPASEIARALQCSVKTVHRRARELQWPCEPGSNALQYSPGCDVLARIAALDRSTEAPAAVTPISVTYQDIASDAAQAAKVEARRAAVELWHEHKHLGKELALSVAIVKVKALHPEFGVSVNSLRSWIKAFAEHGLNGLVEQKRGVVGRRPVEVPDDMVRLGKALVLERGSVARAARELAIHPDLPAGMRMHLHGGHAAKSYVTPSIKRAINPAELTKDLAQGPRHARLKGRWTPGDYSDLRAGDVFVSDDMTSNIISWCEWPNAFGWRIGQAQILPVMDVRSLRWLNVRAIMREGGQYNAQDDIWGLFGDTFDLFGLPADGFVLEGGHWQANVIKGLRTGLDADIRIGGLESLGLTIHRSYDPRSKIIEGQFNQLQHVMDRCPGFVGRDQRRDLGEAIKKRLALLRVKNPKHHPKEFFPHISQLADQVKSSMEAMNHERQDGKVLRGLSPLELWAEHNPALKGIPDSAKWLYRSAMNVAKITANGVRVTRGSGPKMQVYYYDAPEILVPRQGTNVIVHWNDGNPEADACLRCVKTRKFIGLAKFVKPLSRFGATDEQLGAEAKRKQAAMHFARTELRSIQPDLVRSTTPIPVDAGAENMGREIAAATERQAAVESRRARSRRAVATAGVELTAADRAAVLSGPDRASENLSPEEIRELLS